MIEWWEGVAGEILRQECEMLCQNTEYTFLLEHLYWNICIGTFVLEHLYWNICIGSFILRLYMCPIYI